MNGKQLDLFEAKKCLNNKYLTDKPVDVASIVPEEPLIPKNRVFIYPTGGTHPYSKYDKTLEGNDYPFIEDTNYGKKGETKIKEITIRDRVVYPYVALTKSVKIVGRSRSFLICIHKLVGRAFLDPGKLDPYDKYTVIDHIDGKPWNYKVNNLKFLTRSQNSTGWKKISKAEIFAVAKLNKRF